MEKMKQIWPKYVEIKHEDHVDQVRDEYLMITKFKISLDNDNGYPAKTIALFVHNEEFSYRPD